MIFCHLFMQDRTYKMLVPATVDDNSTTSSRKICKYRILAMIVCKNLQSRHVRWQGPKGLFPWPSGNSWTWRQFRREPKMLCKDLHMYVLNFWLIAKLINCKTHFSHTFSVLQKMVNCKTLSFYKTWLKKCLTMCLILLQFTDTDLRETEFFGDFEYQNLHFCGKKILKIL